MLLVTYHQDDDKHNLAAYEDNGTSITQEMLLGVDLTEAELRGFCFAPTVSFGELWVLNGASHQSEILGFKRLGLSLRYTLTARIALYPEIDSLWHPFDLTFSSQGNKLYCYVSNQDTNVVARLEVSTNVTAAPIAPALLQNGLFLKGTFVASSDGKLPNVPKTTEVLLADGGLDVEVKKEKIVSSVRGVIWNSETLYVADEPGEAIKCYDASGGFLGQTQPIEAPVHLHLHEETVKGARVEMLYATGQRGVFWTPLPLRKQAPSIFEFPTQPGIKMEDPSGIAFAPDGTLYVADRKNSQIILYKDFTPNSPPPKPSATFQVGGEPEFILWTAEAP